VYICPNSGTQANRRIDLPMIIEYILTHSRSQEVPPHFV